MKVRSLLLAAAITTSIPVIANAAGDAAAGKTKAFACSSCHGAVGKSAIPTYPNLAGQNEQYIIHALNAYKNGDRKVGQAMIMAGMAKPLSDKDIANLAAYYSSL